MPAGRTGALTTNCDLEPARARGLHRHPADSAPGDAGSAWLHVSAGLGTNPYVRIRVACRPEATLMTLDLRETTMSLVRVHNFSISLDGFGAGEPQSLETPVRPRR